MGWFSNTNNTDRAFNNTIIDSYGERLGGKKTLLEQQKAETAAANLTLNTVQSQMNSLGFAPAQTAQHLAQQYLAASEKLNMHTEELNKMIEGTHSEMTLTAMMLENYALPRFHRQVNLSCKQMVDRAVTGLKHLDTEMPLLRQEHATILANTNQTIQEIRQFSL